MKQIQAKVRIAGRISYVTVQAADSAQARTILKAQYGTQLTILQTKRIH